MLLIREKTEFIFVRAFYHWETAYILNVSWLTLTRHYLGLCLSDYFIFWDEVTRGNTKAIYLLATTSFKSNTLSFCLTPETGIRCHRGSKNLPSGIQDLFKCCVPKYLHAQGLPSTSCCTKHFPLLTQIRALMCKYYLGVITYNFFFFFKIRHLVTSWEWDIQTN